jgi:hypothetical protein
MQNPALLLCDSDALTQLFLANEVRPLRHLKDAYGIQPTIVQEVDLELRWLGKYKDRFVPQLDKALKSSSLCVLDQGRFQALVSSAPAGASWAGFQSLGAQYNGHIGSGEAYTFAAGVTLNLPALSNDFRAIKTLEANLLPLPTPVLRSFDLLVFCQKSGFLDLKTCEQVRADLLKIGEGLPRAFMHSSFWDGMNAFPSRLQEGPLSLHASVANYSTPLLIAKL